VFRDQEFTGDRTSKAVKRIEDVNMLRTRQFAEDAGPMAHPIRPDAYMEINNFYTLTVYEKGAEVVRMIHTLIGKEAFRRGMDLYFKRHDGQAVTCDDFVAAMGSAAGFDFMPFMVWYKQAGTPRVTAHGNYDAAAKRYTLTLKQSCPATPGQAEKAPYFMPVSIGLVDPDGRDMDLGDGKTTRVLHFSQAEQAFVFENIAMHPDDKHLQSTQAITGYHVQAENETIGHVSGFLVDDRTWAIHKLVVETGHWYSGQEILISTNLVERISCEDSKVFVNITIAELQSTSDRPLVNAGIENRKEENSPTTEIGQSATAKSAAKTNFSRPIIGGLSVPA